MLAQNLDAKPVYSKGKIPVATNRNFCSRAVEIASEQKTPARPCRAGVFTSQTSLFDVELDALG